MNLAIRLILCPMTLPQFQFCSLLPYFIVHRICNIHDSVSFLERRNKIINTQTNSGPISQKILRLLIVMFYCCCSLPGNMNSHDFAFRFLERLPSYYSLCIVWFWHLVRTVKNCYLCFANPKQQELKKKLRCLKHADLIITINLFMINWY